MKNWIVLLEKKPEAITEGFFLVFRSGAIVFYRRKADITPLQKTGFASQIRFFLKDKLQSICG
jgi:hypothetical protein